MVCSLSNIVIPDKERLKTVDKRYKGERSSLAVQCIVYTEKFAKVSFFADYPQKLKPAEFSQNIASVFLY